MKYRLNSPIFYGAAYLTLIPLYSLVYWLIPRINESLDPKGLGFFECLYFSAVTITTLGYGDIHPEADAVSAQLTVASEAVLGLIFVGLFLNSAASNGYRLRKVAFDERVVELVRMTVLQQFFAVYHSTGSKLERKRVHYEGLTVAEIKAAMQGVFYKTEVPSSTSSVGQSVARCLTNIQENYDELLNHAEYLDPELIQIISKTNSKRDMTSWVSLYDAEPEVTRYGVIDPHAMDISSSAPRFYEIYQTKLQLQSYWETRFKKHPTVMKSLMVTVMRDFDQYEKAIKIGKRLARYPEHKEFAYQLSLKAYLLLDRPKQARKAFKKIVAINPESADSLINAFAKNHDDITAEQLASLQV